MGDRLADMLAMQRRLQIESYGEDPSSLTPEKRADFFRSMAFALNTELTEVSEEIGWKPWATSRHLNREAYLKELIDAWHFMMNLWLIAGGTADEFYEMYMAKHKVNAKRQEEGYDGTSSKCRNPDCRRALDDYSFTRVRTPQGEFHNAFCSAAFEAKADQDG